MGRRGEAKVKTALEVSNVRDKQRSFHDVTLKYKGSTTQIDHIVISLYGIFVIETKNYGGWIFGGANQPYWTQVFKTKKQRIGNPINQNTKHRKAVADLLELPLEQVVGFVAFVGNGIPKTTFPTNVVWSRRELKQAISAFQSRKYTLAQIQKFSKVIEAKRLEPGAETNELHVRNLQELGARKKNPNLCPRCGGKMRTRKNNKTGEEFLGCANFPKCRGTRKL